MQESAEGSLDPFVDSGGIILWKRNISTALLCFKVYHDIYHVCAVSIHSIVFGIVYLLYIVLCMLYHILVPDLDLYRKYVKVHRGRSCCHKQQTSSFTLSLSS